MCRSPKQLTHTSTNESFSLLTPWFGKPGCPVPVQQARTWFFVRPNPRMLSASLPAHEFFQQLRRTCLGSKDMFPKLRYGSIANIFIVHTFIDFAMLNIELNALRPANTSATIFSFPLSALLDLGSGADRFPRYHAFYLGVRLEGGQSTKLPVIHKIGSPLPRPPR
jgi:hypothetical protein